MQGIIFLTFLFRRCISSINNTSFSCKFVRSDAKSPAFSITGPEVILIFDPISFAIIFESVVFPRPGGPYNKTWSKESPLFFAASI